MILPNHILPWPRREIAERLSVPRLVGHRGAAAEAPENTLAGFELAVALDVGIELDVWLSADGVPVVFHDETLSRTTNGTGIVYQSTAAELKSLDAGSHFAARFADQGVPALADVLATVGGRVWINVELKSSMNRNFAQQTGRRVAHLLRRLATPETVSVSSFDPFSLYGFRQVAPEFTRIQIFKRLMDYDIPVWKKQFLHRWALNPLSRPDLLAPAVELVTPGLVMRARDRGFPLVTWTVDDPDEARRLLDAGVGTLISNRPSLLKKELDL